MAYTPLSSITLHFDYDLVAARRRARQIAPQLGYDEQDGGKAIGHPRRELVHAVAAGGVTEEEDAVWIYVERDDCVLDQAVEQEIDVRFVPEIPVIGRGAWGDVNALRRLVKLGLVLPLLVIDRGGCAAAAVKGDPEGMAFWRRLAERCHQDGHRFSRSFDFASCQLFSAGGSLLAAKSRPHEIEGAVGFAAGFEVILGTQLGNLIYFMVSAAGLGAILIAAPLKFVNGTGSPIRALALVPRR